MIKHQMFIAAALLAGVAIGYFVKDEPVAAEEPKVEEAAKKAVEDKGEEASVKALRRRIVELEKMLRMNAPGRSDGTTDPRSSIKACRTASPRPPQRRTGRWSRIPSAI